MKLDSGFTAPILLCKKDHRFLVNEEVEHAKIEPKAIILEPVGCNTAAGIATTALAVEHDDPDAILAVMLSDHMVRDEAQFVESVKRTASVAATGKLVLFGIKPTDPYAGYGYIRKGAALDGADDGTFAVDAFFGKPDAATAQRYLDDGGYYWNSGTFVLHARTFLEELAVLEPRVLAAARGALTQAKTDLDFLRLDASFFSTSPSISVDCAVMEKRRSAAMFPIDVGWSDVGSWTSLWEISPRDEDDSYANGNAVLEDSTSCYIHAERSLVSTIGVKNLIIVDTPDALLVADKIRSQEVSKVVAKLRRSNRKEHEQHLRNRRPIGYFETLNIGPRFQVKLLHVNSGGKLSMQMHHHRLEDWVVVQGTAKVTNWDEELLVSEGESNYISATAWHRLENPGKVPLELIEVQIGS